MIIKRSGRWFISIQRVKWQILVFLYQRSVSSPASRFNSPQLSTAREKTKLSLLVFWFIKTRFSKRRDRVEKWQRSYLISSVDPRALKHSKSNTRSTFYCWTVFLWAPALTKGAATFILKGVPDRKCSVPLAAVHFPLRYGVQRKLSFQLKPP